MLLQISLGLIFISGFAWAAGQLENPNELIEFMDDIVLEYNTRNIYSSIGKWILVVYIFALPAYGIYYIAAAINQFKRSSTVSVEPPPT